MSEFLRHSFTLLSFIVFATVGCRQTHSDAPQPVGHSSPQQRLEWIEEELLPWMERSAWTYSNVPRADGKLLRTLVEKSGRRSALEVGSANGYSAIWIGLGMEKTGGRLVTVEIDREKSASCRDNVKRAGLEQCVECIAGDALKVVPNLNDRFDFLFVDPGPMDVLPFVKAAEPKLTEGHIIALHNLDFAGSYRSILDYARLKGWMIREVRPRKGYGFFLISPGPLDLDGDQIRFQLHKPSGRLER